VKLGNRRWTLRGPNVPAGARVRVTGVDGTVLIVDRLPG
jgi:membrane protein implicated in regulation of membrane protease activity